MRQHPVDMSFPGLGSGRSQRVLAQEDELGRKEHHLPRRALELPVKLRPLALILPDDGVVPDPCPQFFRPPVVQINVAGSITDGPSPSM